MRLVTTCWRSPTTFVNAATIDAHATQDSHGDTVVTLDAADTLTLEGVTLR